jgi:diguanylate cyclase (GGDEF)-like protein
MPTLPKVRAVVFDKNMNLLLRSDPIFETLFGTIETLTDFNTFLAKNEMLDESFTKKLQMNNKEYHLCYRSIDLAETFEFHFFLLGDEWVVVNPTGRHDIHDELTGLLTERTLLSQLSHEIARAHRDRETHTAIIIDIGHLKEVNEAFGYLTGDTIIKSVAQVLNQRTRKSDSLGRYMGDKFVSVLHKTDMIGTMRYIKKLETAIRTLKFHYQDINFRVNVNCGITMTQPDDTLHSLLQRLQTDLLAKKEASTADIDYF